MAATKSDLKYFVYMSVVVGFIFGSIFATFIMSIIK